MPAIDLIQVHNPGDPPTQVGIIEELKAEGRIRYIGITSRWSFTQVTTRSSGIRRPFSIRPPSAPDSPAPRTPGPTGSRRQLDDWDWKS